MFLGAFLLPNLSLASELVSQHIINNVGTTTGITGIQINLGTTTGNGCLAFSGTARQIVINMASVLTDNASQQYRVQLKTNNNADLIATGYSTTTRTGVPTFLPFNLDSPVNLRTQCIDTASFAWNIDVSSLNGNTFPVGADYATPETIPVRCSSAGCPIGGITSPYLIVYSDIGLSGSITASVATTSGLFSGQNATSTLIALQEQCSQQSNIFGEGLCIAFSFLFVPAPDTLGQFSNLRDEIGNKFPFAYVAGVTDTWETLTASTTLNSPEISYNLNDLGIGSTTSLGNILPNVVVFSSSTVGTYLSPTLLSLLKFLAGLAILLTLIADIFFTSRNLMH